MPLRREFKHVNSDMKIIYMCMSAIYYVDTELSARESILRII
jgi:hypothetical protein